MRIDDTLPIHLNQPVTKSALSEAKPSSASPAFTHFLSDTNDHLLAADQALQALASGHATNLHQTMLTLEEAKLSFQFLEQIRNRLMGAWPDILR